MSDRPRSSEPNEGQSEPRPQDWPRRTTTNRKDSARQLVRLIAARWTLLILAELSHEGRRYQDLHDALGGISYKVLTETLRRAERDGVVTRGLDHASVETTTPARPLSTFSEDSVRALLLMFVTSSRTDRRLLKSPAGWQA